MAHEVPVIATNVEVARSCRDTGWLIPPSELQRWLRRSKRQRPSAALECEAVCARARARFSSESRGEDRSFVYPVNKGATLTSPETSPPILNASFLITGRCGFIGSHLASAFKDGHSVTGLTIFNGSRRNVAHLASNDRFELIEGSVWMKHSRKRLSRAPIACFISPAPSACG